jgi:hypothetical protein
MNRPTATRWLWYAIGGGLPRAQREWVLYDLTCRTWWLRHLGRSLVQLAPVVLVLLVAIPVPVPVRVMAVLFGVAVGLFYSMVYIHETSEHRALKAGYPRGCLQRVRDERRLLERAWRLNPPAV